MADTDVVLIDLSSIAHPIWHMSQSEPNPNHASQAIVARVRALASGHPHVVICCDSGRSFRKDIAPSYKANRPEHEAPLHHQIDLAREQLLADGFPVWAVKGFEADDLIATGTARALASEDLTVLIVSSDKDLLQLVGPRVRAMLASTGAIFDTDAVKAKFGVEPAQMRDFLCLVGDKSDNVKGADGVGPVKAADLLKKYGTLAAVYDALATHGTDFKPAMATALRAFEPIADETRQLITLRSDVDLPWDEISLERVPKDAPVWDTEEAEMDTEQPELFTAPPIQPIDNQIATVAGTPAAAPVVEPADGNGHNHQTATAVAVREPVDVTPAPAEWEMQLEPRNMRDARALATDMHASRLFSAYGTPSAILSTVMAGRELGMQAMASLRAFHLIDGKPTLAADLIRALVIRSGKAEYFRCTERTPERATFVTKRGDDPPFALTYTIEDGRAAFTGAKADSWEKSSWGKNPADMCVARASVKLARLIYPDVIHGLYSVEEYD